MSNGIVVVQVSDTTKDDSRNKAGPKKIFQIASAHLILSYKNIFLFRLAMVFKLPPTASSPDPN
jgi:hypothetical protein